MNPEEQSKEGTVSSSPVGKQINISLIGAIILGLVAYAPLFLPNSFEGGAIGGLLSYSFLAGLWAILALYSKGYGGKIPFLIWLLFGWNVILALMFCLVPVMLFFTAFFPDLNKDKKKCVYCKESIIQDAIRCPKCQGDLALAVEG